MLEYVSPKLVESMSDFAPHQSEISKFVFLRTYSRYLEQKNRREYWHETPARVVNFSMELERKHLENLGLPFDFKRMKSEADELYTNIYNLRQFPSGRTMWVGGADKGLGERFALANFNCSFTNVARWEDLPEIFYLLLVGTGAGFKNIFQLVNNLDPIRSDIESIHIPYETVFPGIRVAETNLYVNFETGVAEIQVGDSKEGKQNHTCPL